MWDSVRAAFVPFTQRFEGKTDWLYLDVKCLVTIGFGDLVDPIDAALGLPFVHVPTGGPASVDEVREAWAVVKSRRDMAPDGGDKFAPLTNIRLTPAGVASLAAGRLAIDEADLRHRFPAWDLWPADAQLATLSMAWALGPGALRTARMAKLGVPPASVGALAMLMALMFPRWDAAARAQDWATCAVQCHISTLGNPGVGPRNAANVLLFDAAQRTKEQPLDPSELHGYAAPAG